MRFIRTGAAAVGLLLATLGLVAATPAQADAQYYRWHGRHAYPYYWNGGYGYYGGYRPYANWYGAYRPYYGGYPSYYNWAWYW